MEMNYASKGTGAAALTTGIIGTVLGAASGAGGLLGFHNGGDYVSKEAYDIQLQLINSERRNAILEADLSSEKKMVEVFNASNEKINGVRDELQNQIRALDSKVDANVAAQGVINATVGSQMAVNTSTINQLYGMCKLVIPNSSVCPGWGAVSIQPAVSMSGTTIS